MKVMYMSHRYHTNQNAIVEGWKKHGDEVLFCSQYAGKIEDYSIIKPIVVGYSPVYRFFDYIYVNILAKNNPAAIDFKIKCGFPPAFKLIKIIKDFKPDIVIMRERSLYSIFTNTICKCMGIPTSLYVMNPVWGEAPKQDLPHKIVRGLTPKYRLTPSRVIGDDYTGKVEDKNAFFAPYLMNPQLSPEEKQYFQDGSINIFAIGKYQERKNHFLMIKAVEKLKSEFPNIHLNIAGELSNNFHQEYYDRVVKYLKEHKLEDTVTLYQNLKKEQVQDLYKKTDVFVIPSTGEPGAVSHLEAMAFSIPVMGGSDNGTADYIVSGETGYIFKDNDLDDLTEKLRSIIQCKEEVERMGRNAYNHVKENFQFKQYHKSVMQIMKKYGK